MAILQQLADSGGETLTFVNDAATGLRAIIAVHSTRRGPAFGGIRTLSYRSQNAAVEDALRLAQAMSYKAAVADLPAGGGKTVVLKHPEMRRAEAFRALGRAIQRMGGSYFTGLDVGTSREDLQEVASETKYAASTLDFGKATARGLMAAIRAGLKAATGSDELEGRRVAIQGLGAVGGELARLLHGKGAALVVADTNAQLGLQVAEETGAEVVSPSRVLATSCDVLSPCALGSVLTAHVAENLHCKVVAGSANNQLATPAAGEALRKAGIVYVPDYVANAGALIKGVTEHVKGREVGFEVVDRIYDTALLVLTRAARENRPPSQVADDVARERLR
ncbi:MAG: Glu/Leu/Phe/Val dehydrogenase [Planctomycetes bacterium]|nr:Glu/Leu/Phe/Val dehydrogenase [Planctomycetota bacterium]